jgi:hypothetical protein
VRNLGAYSSFEMASPQKAAFSAVPVGSRSVVTFALGLMLAALATLFGSLLAIEKAGADGGAKWAGAALLSLAGALIALGSRPALVSSRRPLLRAFAREATAEASEAPPLALGYLTLVTLALLSTGAALIHFVVIEMHAEEWWLFGAAFAAMALAQQVWAVFVLTHPNRMLYAAGAVLNTGIIIVWIVSRSSGLPFGPDAGEPEAIGFSDVVATVFELLIALGAIALLRPRPLGRPLRRAAVPLLAAAIAAVVVCTAFALFSAVGTSSFLPHTE